MGVSIRKPGQRMFGGRANIADDEPFPRGGKSRPRQARSLPKDRSLHQMTRVVYHQVSHQLLEGRSGRERLGKGLPIPCLLYIHTACRVPHRGRAR